MRLCLALAAFAITAAAPALAADCPPRDREATLKALGNAGSCRAAVRLLERCAWGTGQDVEFSRVVLDKCEPDVPDQRLKAYEREKQACRERHGGERGTMYVSFAAVCEAKAALRFSTGSR